MNCFESAQKFIAPWVNPLITSSQSSFNWISWTDFGECLPSVSADSNQMVFFLVFFLFAGCLVILSFLVGRYYRDVHPSNFSFQSSSFGQPFILSKVLCSEILGRSLWSFFFFFLILSHLPALFPWKPWMDRSKARGESRPSPLLF